MPNGMDLETHCSDGMAPCRGAEKLKPHSHKKHWRCPRQRAVCRGTFYYPTAVKPGCRRIHIGTRWNGCYIMGYALSSTAENSPSTVSQLLQGLLSMVKQGCGKIQIAIHLQTFQQLNQHLMKPCHLDKISCLYLYCPYRCVIPKSRRYILSNTTH
jgi:hypothetical protein